jgi:YidC/Oxa1 family membrane protein insertase
MSLLDPAVSVLHALLVHLAAQLPGPLSVQLSVAICLLTFGLRGALLPAAVRSLKSQRARTALVPQVEVLRKKHRHDRASLGREINELHRREGISPLAGLGPLLLTAAATMTLFRMVSLLGSPLGTHWLPLLSTGGAVAACVLGGLLAALLLVAWLSYRQQSAGRFVLRVLPFGTVAFAALAPLAVSVYLLSSTAWTVAERAVLPRLV